MAAAHITVRRNTDRFSLELRVGSSCWCPFCSTDVFRPRERHKTLAHLQGHRLRAVHHGRIVDWKSVCPEVRKNNRVEFELTRCDGCGCIYKNTVGYCGIGQKGAFTAFYAAPDFEGFCSMDCYYSKHE